jgi:hypothetical protein
MRRLVLWAAILIVWLCATLFMRSGAWLQR